MIVLHSDKHKSYSPARDYSDGMPGVSYPESPERVARVLEGLGRLGIISQEVASHIRDDIAFEAHDEDYVNFLRNICSELPENHDHVATIFHDRTYNSGAPIMMRAGSYTNEVGTPLVRATFDAAINSLKLAHEGAAVLLERGGEVFSVTRPPGHHAGRSSYRGYCFFNNGAHAAYMLRRSGPVAILDLDYHIGDGTLEFLTEDIRYYSIHMDPLRSYPYRTFPDEDHPFAKLYQLSAGTRIDYYINVLNKVIGSIREYNPEYLVVLLGLDGIANDPVQDEALNIEPKDFERIGTALKKLDIPKLFLLEGGYYLEQLEEGVYSFFNSFL